MLKAFLFGTTKSNTFTIDTIDLSEDPSSDLKEILSYTSPQILCLCNLPEKFETKNTTYQYQLATTRSLVLSKYPLYPIHSYIPHNTIYGRPISHPIECFIIRIDLSQRLNHLLIFTNIPKVLDNEPCQTDMVPVTLSHILHCAYREVHEFIVNSIRITNPTKTVILFTGDFGTTVTNQPDQKTNNCVMDECDLIVQFARNKVMDQLRCIPLLGIGKAYLKECGTWIQKFCMWIRGGVDGLTKFLDEIEVYRIKMNFPNSVSMTHLTMYNILTKFQAIMHINIKADALTGLLLSKKDVITLKDFQFDYEPFYDDVILEGKGGRAMNKDFMMMERILEATSLNFLTENPILTDRTLQTLIMNTFSHKNGTAFLAGARCDDFQFLPNCNKELPYKMKGISVTFTEDFENLVH
ncbi:hypothetical protein EDI_045870 [Entamoeba dispar SAW760]|uniref:Uncharacterized protein n=1 Tax=Entamoeba dispar (strain ATCC PRA-260 / SAW760) TaxID=370354 RepID=B0EE27_ENTDS|nr:uncharacterized protein EDI_045870 [Entamoeba dispar SAW760]EDR27213.1 hypothetical protein EDI_045870 [Entamoeba dispar SAW760]|eukprot:EDR27213.1 hypothetical protein EDI_045870 [Entamoeba dispar SAW760]